ncbi:MAG: thioredoxin family protein [Alistipes sp.]|nr:thioredoxin family protein [Alistipes sp.]MDE7069624.1 thioredoxin family protein [Alistipes sp.]
MKDFEKIIGRQAVTLVYFFTPHCTPCQLMEPALDLFERRMNGRVDIYRIDTYSPEAAHLLARYGIHSTPALLFFREGSLLWRNDGPMSYEELKTTLEEIEEFEYEYIF